MGKTSFCAAGLAVLAAGIAWGCGSGDSGLDGAGGGNTGGVAGNTASGGAAGTSGSAGSASGGSAGLSCQGDHPLVDAGDRYCGEGECRCIASDKCFSDKDAARCCEGELECFREGGRFECKGAHPQVDGSARFCENGDCYCEARDACLPAEIAATCCPETPKCD